MAYFYKCVIPGAPTRRLRKKRLRAPLFRSWQNAGGQGGWLRRRKEELRYDGQGPYWSCVAAPRRGGRWPLPLAPSALPPLRNSQCSQQVALTKVSKTRQPIQIFQRKVFKKQTLQVGLGETSMLPHKAEVEGRRRLQLQFPDAKLCRQQANGTTGRCFESWASENTKKNAVKPLFLSGTRFTPPLGAGLQPRL